jgi:hypothetical protein
MVNRCAPQLRAQAANAREMDNLTKLRIRDLLNDEEYLKQRQELERQQIGITQRLEALRRNQGRFEPEQSLISLNKMLVSRFAAADLQKKRLILNIVGSNLVLKDRKLSIDARKPFRKWSPYVENSEMRAFVKVVRTFFAEETPESLEMYSRIQEILKEEPALKRAARIPTVPLDEFTHVKSGVKFRAAKNFSSQPMNHSEAAVDEFSNDSCDELGACSQLSLATFNCMDLFTP